MPITSNQTLDAEQLVSNYKNKQE